MEIIYGKFSNQNVVIYGYLECKNEDRPIKQTEENQ